MQLPEGLENTTYQPCKIVAQQVYYYTKLECRIINWINGKEVFQGTECEKQNKTYIANIFDNGQVGQASLVLLPNQSVSIYKIVDFGVF